MQRNLPALTRHAYDLLIIGGGIYGACVAWDASLRRLSVALVDKADFASSTSANSLKIIHGGLRYLQHADFRRMRESLRERTTLMRIAPHLVHPLPFVIPTYGHGMQGQELFSLALLVNRLVGFACERLADPQKCTPPGHVVSTREALQLLPTLERKGLTGAAIFYDAQVYNSERLLLSFLRSAEGAGADLANYVEVVGFLKQGERVIGVEAQDVLTGDRFDIRAKMVVNASGPWVEQVLGLARAPRLTRHLPLARAINLVTRSLFDAYAIGVASKDGDEDGHAMLDKGRRLLFITPWRGHSLIGTAYGLYAGGPDELKLTERHIQQFLTQINRACPSARLKREEVFFVHSGLLPCSGVDPKTGAVQLMRHYQIRDHRQEGVEGLMSLVGVKYTTARDVAAKAVDRVFEAWGYKPPKAMSAHTPLHGGQIDRFHAFMQAALEKRPPGLAEEAVRRLVYNHGSAYPRVLQYLKCPAAACHVPPDPHAVLKAEALHGMREEMAQKLSDVVFRRTDLGTTGYPGTEALKICADLMRAEFNWSLSRTEQEWQEVHNALGMKP
jgi:glycerol-3-phosphate dehydrogenase